ncbi:hypothetical protein BGZ54_004992 [Gamsiella multidivaricata]|nr:hypothetical protein BGZ54_004992 [Gamsiella multidivaricata]
MGLLGPLPSATRRLKDVIEASGAYYYFEIGYGDVILSSSIIAKQFYETLVKARRTHYLVVRLKWDGTLKDLRVLEAAINRINISKLYIQAMGDKEPLFDVINRGRRYDPLLQLMANGWIQNMEINTSGSFYRRVSKSFVMTHHLRRLCIVSSFLPGEPLPSSLLASILKYCPALKVLYHDRQHTRYVQGIQARNIHVSEP